MSYLKSLPSTSKYRFKKIVFKVFGRDPWRSKEQVEQTAMESENLPNLMCDNESQHSSPCDDPSASVSGRGSNDLPLNVSQPTSNPTPIKIKPQSDLNVLEEETCVTATDFRTELLTGDNSHNKKLYDYKIKLKNLISKIDKLSLSNYTVLEDCRTSEENLIFSNELKDTGNYLIEMGNQFIDRATAMEIVASNCPPAEGDNPLSEDDELIYISTEQLKCETQIEDDKKMQSKFIPFKKEKTPS